MDIAAEFLSAIINAFEANKHLADRAVEQVPDNKLHVALDSNTNSIAVMMKHVAGNLISRWTDFLTADGEKPWRNRDDEFVDSFRSRTELLELWEQGWACVKAWGVPLIDQGGHAAEYLGGLAIVPEDGLQVALDDRGGGDGLFLRSGRVKQRRHGRCRACQELASGGRHVTSPR
jgi:hypothetical protein